MGLSTIIKFSKKSTILFVLTAIFFALNTVPYFQHYAEARTLVFYDGDLIRERGDSKVYLLSPGHRRWIRSIEVFNSYNFKWEDVRVVPPTVLTVFEFTNLIRRVGDEKVYLINESGFKRHIPSPEVFASYGFDWNDVALVPSIEIQSYPESHLIRQEGDERVYFIENKTKRWIETAEAFNSQGFDWNEVRVINTTESNFFQTGEVITLQAPKVDIPVSIPEPKEESEEGVQEEPKTDTTEPFSSTTTEPSPEPIAQVPISGGGGGSPTSPDSNAPSVITNLSVSKTSTSTITITWTSPGSNGNTGTATSYDIRHSTSNITEDNWASATQTGGEPNPKTSGSSEEVTLGVFAPGITYYFAIKTRDEAGNKSTLSNIASGVTDALPAPISPSSPPDITAPASISNLSASNPTFSSVDLTWTAPGDDGSTGTATNYIVRYSTNSFTAFENWFRDAIQPSPGEPSFGEPTPQVAGSAESMTVSGLSSGTTYYFGMKSSDEVGNRSEISNISSATTVACETSASGSQIYNVSSGSGQPQIQQVTINPVDYTVGVSQTITVTARDTNSNAITSMNAKFITDTGQSTIPLSLSSGSNTSGSWSATWTPTDTRCGGYNVEVTATSDSGTPTATLSL